MKPVLIVEGIRKNVTNISFNEKGEATHISVDVDGSHQVYSTRLDDVKLVWEGRYEPISEAIRKRIEAYEERQIEIAVDCMEQELPKQERKELKREYKDLDVRVEGLTEGLGIIREVETGDTFEKRIARFAENVMQSLRKPVNVDE